MPSLLRLLLSSLLLLSSANIHAETSSLKAFNSGSYQQLLNSQAQHGFMLAIWSIDCPSCLKDMALLSELRKKHPQLKLILLSSDEASASEEVQAMLNHHQLADAENWLFGSDDAEKLRYEIDPKWYGELPRTYLFNAAHQRIAKSGALTLDEFEALIKQAGL